MRWKFLEQIVYRLVLLLPLHHMGSIGSWNDVDEAQCQLSSTFNANAL